MQKIKIAVTGAAGQIAYSLLFRIISGEVFGKDTMVDLHLLEVEAAYPKLEGLRMELEDCASPLLNKVIYTADANAAMRDVNWALLVGAAPRKAGMQRAELLKINGEIFVKQGRALNENANSDVRVLVIGNPCNTNCLIAMEQARDIPRDRFFALTKLDENRARALLAARANVVVDQVSNMIIWGNHSATQYPDFYNAKINNDLVPTVIKDQQWLKNDFMTEVQQRGATIIKTRGASSAASAANAIVDCIHDLNNYAAGEIFSVAKCSQGEYGIDKGLIFSFPCFIKSNVLKVIMDVAHNEYGQQKLKETLEELRQEREMAKQLGLIA